MGDAVPVEVKRSFPIINITAWHGDISVGGGNLGLGPDQVTLGFNGDGPAAQAFANRTVHRLQQTWDVMKVPNDRGAFPLKDCPRNGKLIGTKPGWPIPK